MTTRADRRSKMRRDKSRGKLRHRGCGDAGCGICAENRKHKHRPDREGIVDASPKAPQESSDK